MRCRAGSEGLQYLPLLPATYLDSWIKALLAEVVDMVRGIRGAVTVESDTSEAILEATKRLLESMLNANHVNRAEIASIIFTCTPDLKSEFPAAAARDLGLTYVPLLCARELDVRASLKRCIRILVHVNTTASQEEIQHVYLGEAKKLRPDLCR